MAFPYFSVFCRIRGFFLLHGKIAPSRCIRHIVEGGQASLLYRLFALIGGMCHSHSTGMSFCRKKKVEEDTVLGPRLVSFLLSCRLFVAHNKKRMGRLGPSSISIAIC